MSKAKWLFDIEQNTDEWHDLKLHKFSASQANNLMMDKKNKGYQNLIAKISEEYITKTECESDSFKGNWATERGHELEPIARNDYELRTFNAVNLVGIVIKDEFTCCSPDGYLDRKTLHQIKCPIFSTHKDYLIKSNNGDNWIKKDYFLQSQFELLVTDADIVIFTSYHPMLPAIDAIIERNDNVIANIAERLQEAIEEVKNEVDLILNLK